MRFVLAAAVAVLAVAFGADSAEAKSCSTFAVIKTYDAAKNTVTFETERGSQRKFFPKPEGANTDTTKIPKACTGRMKKADSADVKPTGGRLSVTQVRSNFDGKMQNDLEDEGWLAKQLKMLIDGKTTVVAVLRPGVSRDDAPMLTTVYLPITPEELAEIARIDAQAEDVD